MQLTVENFNKKGTGFINNGVWYNADRSLVGGLGDLKKGNVIDAEVKVNGDFNNITSYKVSEGGAVATSSDKKEFKSSSFKGESSDTQDRIARGNATNAVFGSPFIGKWMESLYDSDAERIQETIRLIDKVATFIGTGKMEAK